MGRKSWPLIPTPCLSNYGLFPCPAMHGIACTPLIQQAVSQQPDDHCQPMGHPLPCTVQASKLLDNFSLQDLDSGHSRSQTVEACAERGCSKVPFYDPDVALCVWGLCVCDIRASSAKRVVCSRFLKLP